MMLLKTLMNIGTLFIFGGLSIIDDNGGGNPDDNPDNKPDNGGTKTWRDELPDDIKGNPVFEKYNSREDALKGLISAQEMIGKKGVVPPDDNSSKEEWDNFYNELGRPENPDDYELSEPELPEGVTVDEGLVQSFKEKAHEFGLNSKQAKNLYEWYNKETANIYGQNMENKEQSMKDAETNLRKTLGKAYDEKLGIARKLIDGADEKQMAFFEEHGNDPRLINFLVDVGSKLGEDTISGTPKSFTKTPDEAKAEILRVKSDPSHPFNIEDHPERQMAKKHMDSLYKMAYPELAKDTR